MYVHARVHVREYVCTYVRGYTGKRLSFLGGEGLVEELKAHEQALRRKEEKEGRFGKGLTSSDVFEQEHHQPS